MCSAQSPIPLVREGGCAAEEVEVQYVLSARLCVLRSILYKRALHCDTQTHAERKREECVREAKTSIAIVWYLFTARPEGRMGTS